MAGGDVPYLGLLHAVVLGLSREDKTWAGSGGGETTGWQVTEKGHVPPVKNK